MKKILLFVFSAILFAACENLPQPGDEPIVDPSLYGNGLTSDPQQPNADQACTLYYKADASSPFYNYTEDIYAHIGIVNETWECVQANWNENKDKCKFIPIAKNLWKLPLEPTIRGYFSSGTKTVEKIGVVVRNANGSKQTSDISSA